MNNPHHGAVSRFTVESRSLPASLPPRLRHAHAAAGFDVRTVAARAGWKDAAIILKTYAHAIEDKAAADAVLRTQFAQGRKKQPSAR